jgi:hypothetical protein
MQVIAEGELQFHFAETVSVCKLDDTAFFREQSPDPRKLRHQQPDPRTLRLKLRQALRAIDPNALAGTAALLNGKTPWTVRLLDHGTATR